MYTLLSTDKDVTYYLTHPSSRQTKPELP